jgi:DNA repair exonuclease SbcCD ATPase subunit
MKNNKQEIKTPKQNPNKTQTKKEKGKREKGKKKREKERKEEKNVKVVELQGFSIAGHACPCLNSSLAL